MKDLRAVHFFEVKKELVGNRLTIFEALVMRGPSTGTELAIFTSWKITSVRPRLTQLRQMWHAIETGHRRDGEYVFRAILEPEAMQLHEEARRRWAIENRAHERVTFVSRKIEQLELMPA